jgi:hypothetical protein
MRTTEFACESSEVTVLRRLYDPCAMRTLPRASAWMRCVGVADGPSPGALPWLPLQLGDGRNHVVAWPRAWRSKSSTTRSPSTRPISSSPPPAGRTAGVARRSGIPVIPDTIAVCSASGVRSRTQSPYVGRRTSRSALVSTCPIVMPSRRPPASAVAPGTSSPDDPPVVISRDQSWQAARDQAAVVGSLPIRRLAAGLVARVDGRPVEPCVLRVGQTWGDLTVLDPGSADAMDDHLETRLLPAAPADPRPPDRALSL